MVGLSVKTLFWHLSVVAILLSIAVAHSLLTTTGPFDGGLAGRLAMYVLARVLLLALGLRNYLVFQVGAVVLLAFGYTWFQTMLNARLGVINTIPPRLHLYGDMLFYSLYFLIDSWFSKLLKKRKTRSKDGDSRSRYF